MNIDKKLLELRRLVRRNGKSVMRKLFDDYVTGPIAKKIIPSCFLCGVEDNLTKEHVSPRWVFESNPKHFFVTDVNKLNQPYISAVLPACKRCNSDLLNSLERYIQKTFLEIDLTKKYYNQEQWDSIIRWLEIIDFKFQVLDIATKFRAHKDAGYVPFLADLSIAYMRNFSVRAVTSKARLALKRIATKDKSKRAGCLIVAKMKNKSFHYFHQSGEFIYLEVPTYRKAFFYFFEREFKNDRAVKRAALKLIKEVYET